MTDEVIRQFIELIRKEWMSIDEDIRPLGVWIRQYGPVRIKENPMLQTWKATPIAVWYLSPSGVQSSSVDTWLAYQNVRQQDAAPPWVKRTFREGLTAFAECAGNEDYYWEYLWGKRWGAGWRVQMNEDGGLQIVDQLWVS